MAKNVEQDIQKHLSEGASVSEVALHFINSRDNYPYDETNHIQLAQFFFNTGHFKELLNECKKQLQQGQPIAWHLLFLTLKKFNPDHAERIAAKFIRAATESGQLSVLSKIPNSADLPLEFALMKKKFNKKVLDKAQSKKEKLFEKLGFLRQEQIIEEEYKVIKEIELFYPNDGRVPEILAEFKQRWARYMVSKKPLTVFNDEIERLEIPTAGEKKLAALWLSSCCEIVEKNPSASYNFAIMFYFMGCFEEALIMAEKTESSKNLSWFLVDILIKTRRFVQALDEIDRLEEKYGADPETQFSATYLKAIAHWGLHQGAMAIELMKSIVSIRPNYRSAQSLFSKWNGGLE